MMLFFQEIILLVPPRTRTNFEISKQRYHEDEDCVPPYILLILLGDLFLILIAERNIYTTRLSLR